MSSSSTQAPLVTFSVFPQLPPELRQKIFKISIRNVNPFVRVCWDRRTDSFRPGFGTPSILHVNREARDIGSSYWTQAFGPFVYVNFDDELVYFDWSTLGASPGTLGSKLGDDECEKVRSLAILEDQLLAHATLNLEELERFTSLDSILVICDPDKVETGDQYGSEGIEDHSQYLDREPLRGDFKWPTVACTNPHGDEKCSRHWWFDGWNQRATSFNKGRDWHDGFAECVRLVDEDERRVENVSQIREPSLTDTVRGSSVFR